MTPSVIIQNRLINQQIMETKFRFPQEIVSWFVAMQAQDYAMAKWAIGLRIKVIKDNDVEKEFTEGKILRTHIMRPTWHFITPEDIYWLLDLTAPRVNAVNRSIYRKFELDEKFFGRSNDILIKSLEGGKQLTRAMLKEALEKSKINAEGLRLGYILMRAELDGIICSGARMGKQFTYVLLNEIAPKTRLYSREEALAELSLRYFRSRGPASLQDFAWWSGLTMKDAKEGAANLPDYFLQEKIDGQLYFYSPVEAENNSVRKGESTFLLPDYDEYGISYKNRSALRTDKKTTTEYQRVNDFSHWIIIDGKIAGTWERVIKKDKIEVTVYPFIKLNKPQIQALKNAVKRYNLFLR